MTDETVVEEKPDGQTDTSGTQDAQEQVDLDSILNEWKESETPESEPEPQKVTADDLQESLKWIRQHQEQTQQEQTQRDISKAVETIREEMGDSALSEKTIRRMLNGAAGEDERVRNAWVGRHQNPEGYMRVLKGLAKEFSSEVAAMPDKGITQDRDAITAAARGASTKVSDDPDIPENIASMGDQDFERWVESQDTRKK